VSQTKCDTHVQDVALKNAEMRDPSTTHGTVITHFCVTRRQGVKNMQTVKWFNDTSHQATSFQSAVHCHKQNMHSKITNVSPTKCTYSQLTLLLLYFLLNVSDLLGHHRRELNTRQKKYKILLVCITTRKCSCCMYKSQQQYIHTDYEC